MKKFLPIFLCVLTVAFASCSKDTSHDGDLSFDMPVVSEIAANAVTVKCQVFGVDISSLPVCFAYGDETMTPGEYTVVKEVTKDGNTFSCRLAGLKSETSYKIIGFMDVGDVRFSSPAASFKTTKIPDGQPVLMITSGTAIPAEPQAGTYTITYEVVNPVADGLVEAACPSSWVKAFDDTTDGEISFDVDENTGAERTAVITLAYPGAESCKVEVVQRGAGGENPEVKEIALSADDEGWPKSYSKSTSRVGDYYYQLNDVANFSNGNGVQFKKSSGSMANAEDVGIISRVELTLKSNSGSDIALFLGEQSGPDQNEVTPTRTGDTYVFDCTGKSFHYFSLANQGSACFVTSFKIVCGDKGGVTPPPADPQFETPAYSALTKNSATISCTYSYTGDKAVSEAYFLYSAASGAEQRVNVTSALPGEKTAQLSGLTPATHHSFRLCVVVDGKTYSSTACAFTTYDEQDRPSTDARYAGWAELPSENSQLINSEYYYAYHLCPDYPKSGTKARNFTTCYSKSKKCPVWVAAPLHDCYTGSVDRTNSYRTDPDVKCSQAGRWGGYTRGHMLGSNERRVTTSVNRDVFYYSNIGPQIQTYFNTGGGQWNTAEDWVDKQWRGLADTLYQVVGTYWENTSKVVDGTTIPTHYYIVLLKAKQNVRKKWVVNCTADELQTIAIMVRHKAYAKGEVVKPADFKAQGVFKTVAEIEALTGVNFFPNVPSAPKNTFNVNDWTF